MKPEVFTIGYAGSNLRDVLDQLEDADVSLVIDVREIPISRKRGFSKTAFSKALEGNGICYRHIKALGSPKVVRHAVRETGNYKQFFMKVRKHLRQQEENLGSVVDLIKNNRVCLMCCCSDWQRCHRKCIVEELTKRHSMKITHLSAFSGAFS